jgi:hypothetical protein
VTIAGFKLPLDPVSAEAFFERRTLDGFVPTVLDRDHAPGFHLRLERFHFIPSGKTGDLVIVNEAATVGDRHFEGDVIEVIKITFLGILFEERTGEKGG